MARTFTPTRQFIPGGVGNSQQIHDTKYATRSLAAVAIPGATNFFGAAPSSDFTVDRYRDRLRELHQRIEADGPFITHATRVLVEARKAGPSAG